MHQGLTSAKAIALQAKYGRNEITTKEGEPWYVLFFRQFKNPLTYILLGVAVLSLFLNELTDTILAISVTLLNVVIGFAQEYKAQKTLVALRRVLQPMAVALRDGRRLNLEAADLVPGDLVLLNAGDRVPADGRLLECFDLLVNEAVMTGEAEGARKGLDAANRSVLMGTTVLYGRGLMRVDKIGAQTAIGQIGLGLSAIQEGKTPIQLKLEEFGHALGQLVIVICFVIFIVGTLYGNSPFEMAGYAVILSVAAIPEGLPVAITVILALGMRRILKRRGLVKRLISIKTLGSTSVICTDKTGTLTEGKMKVVRFAFADRARALLGLSLANNQRTGVEAALWEFLEKQSPESLSQVLAAHPRVFEEPFDSAKKYQLSVNLVRGRETAFLLGAPDIIMEFCALNASERSALAGRLDEWAGQGLKLIGLADKSRGDLRAKQGFRWLGLLAIADPLRPEARSMIETVKRAGIKVKIVTGDYRKTAEAVARLLGFTVNDQTVVEGRVLESLSGRRLAAAVKRGLIFTRVTPAQKLKIVEALQGQGEIVAMTGDGVNDALALKAADIGVVVGDATEVAKETADLILLDNNFKTIVAAVEEGRLILANIKKVVGYVLSNSFDSLILVFGAILLHLPAPVTIVQILFVRLICDGPLDLVLSFEPKERGLMEASPRALKKDSVLSAPMKWLIASVSAVIGLATLFAFQYYYRATGDLALAQTVAFVTLSFISISYIFSFKNLRAPFYRSENLWRNWPMFLAIAYGLILVFSSTYWPSWRSGLGTVPLQLEHWVVILGIGAAAVVCVESFKKFSRGRL